MKKMTMNKLAVAMGLMSALECGYAYAGVATFNWNGYLTFLDAQGAAIANPSIPAKGNNQYYTPISGTLAFDTVSGAGAATLAPFDLLNGSLPAEVQSFELQAIGDGIGGSGSLVLGNMLYSWGGASGLPVSVVMDASGFFQGENAPGGENSAIPAADGTYVGESVPGAVIGPGGYAGYLGLGAVPIATTAWNTTISAACELNCNFAFPSGTLPLVTDTASNPNDYTPNTGGAIGGSPMQAGPFGASNFNFDFTNLSLTGFDSNGHVSVGCVNPDYLYNVTYAGCPVPQVPAPAAVWLFGSGLLVMLGMGMNRGKIWP